MLPKARTRIHREESNMDHSCPTSRKKCGLSADELGTIVVGRGTSAHSMSEIQTRIEEVSDQERRFIVQSLIGYNDSHVAPENYRDLVIVSRHSDQIVGSVLAYTHWNWLFVKHLWVAEAYRKLGLGRNLMQAAEREAVSRGCIHAHLDTFDFQARPFYEKLGYQMFGQLQDYPTGHTRYFLCKRNLGEQEPA